MPIEINGLNAHKLRQANSRSTAKGDKSVTSDSSSAAASDTVSLTNTASHLKQMEEQLASQPVVDNQRIQKVQDAIRSGEYHVDAEKVADKIIEMEASLDKSK